MGNQSIIKAWESAPEAALAALKQEPLYERLSWYVQRQLHARTQELKAAQPETTQGMDTVVLTDELSPNTDMWRAEIAGQVAGAARRAEVTAIAQARATLLNAIPALQVAEMDARKQLDAAIAAERAIIDRLEGKVPEFAASSERRIAGWIAAFDATYTKPGPRPDPNAPLLVLDLTPYQRPY